jgi:hypothetical protein
MKATIHYLVACAVAVAIVFIIAATGRAASEADHRDKWCAGVGETEVITKAGTRVDCVTATHAV